MILIDCRWRPHGQLDARLQWSNNKKSCYRQHSCSFRTVTNEEQEVYIYISLVTVQAKDENITNCWAKYLPNLAFHGLTNQKKKHLTIESFLYFLLFCDHLFKKGTIINFQIVIISFMNTDLHNVARTRDCAISYNKHDENVYRNMDH